MGGQMEGLVFGVLLAMSSICLAVALVVVSWFVVGGGCVPERGSETLTVELSTCICQATFTVQLCHILIYGSMHSFLERVYLNFGGHFGHRVR